MTFRVGEVRCANCLRPEQEHCQTCQSCENEPAQECLVTALPAPGPVPVGPAPEDERVAFRAAFNAVCSALLGKGEVAPTRSSEFYRYVVTEVLDAVDHDALRADLASATAALTAERAAHAAEVERLRGGLRAMARRSVRWRRHSVVARRDHEWTLGQCKRSVDEYRAEIARLRAEADERERALAEACRRASDGDDTMVKAGQMAVELMALRAEADEYERALAELREENARNYRSGLDEGSARELATSAALRRTNERLRAELARLRTGDNATRVGSCGNAPPRFGRPLADIPYCTLPAGHAGFHRDDRGGEWGKKWNDAPDAVLEAAVRLVASLDGTDCTAAEFVEQLRQPDMADIPGYVGRYELAKLVEAVSASGARGWWSTNSDEEGETDGG